MAEKKKVNEKCPCTYPGCTRHGQCEDCKAYHHEMGQKTACERAKK